MRLNKQNFMLAVRSLENWDYSKKQYLFCYICQKTFNTETIRYIYGSINPGISNPEKSGEEIRDILEEMWLVVLKEQEKNPKLTHIYL